MWKTNCQVHKLFPKFLTHQCEHSLTNQEECNNSELHRGSLDPAAKHQLTVSGPTWKICSASQVFVQQIQCPSSSVHASHVSISSSFRQPLWECLKLDMERKVLLYDRSLATVLLPTRSSFSCALGSCSSSRGPAERWCRYRRRRWHRWGPSVSLRFPAQRWYGSKQ